MQLIRKGNRQSLPGWSQLSDFGVYTMQPGETGDLHFHDFDEVWYVVSGSATVQCAGQRLVLNASDALFTPAGEEHQIQLVHEPFTVVFTSYLLQGRCRPGHLHHAPDSSL